MIRSLVVKELWDLRGVIALGALAHAMVLANLLGMKVYEWLPMRDPDELPFPSSFGNFLAFYSFLFAGALGLMQGLSDSRGQRWLFVLPLPIRREHWILGKLGIGFAIWLLFALGTLLLGIGIVHIPGVFPAPFEWWMARKTFHWLVLIPVVYLGGFLSGIRPGSWFGTRLLPLLGAGLFAALIIESTDLVYSPVSAFDRVSPFLWVYGLCFGLFYASMILAILQVAQKRDYP